LDSGAKLKQYNEAIEDYEIFHQHCQDHLLSYYQKGIAYFNIQKYHKAVEAFNCAVTICQTSQFNYYFNGVWGHNYYNEAVKQYDLEIECFKEADQLKVDDAFSYYEWAKTCFKLGDQETSLSMLREAIKLDMNIKDLVYNNEMFRTFNDNL
jgi:tetratricopeptide (TPR) repeat protein